VIVDLIGFGIVMPVLPFYAKEFGASATTLGVLLAGYAAAQFVFAPVWGRLSDRVGRRGVLLFTIAGTALSLLGLGLASSLVGVFVARVAAGAFAANLAVASAYIADTTPPDERTRWMGMLGASFGIGFLVGPAIGGALAPFGYRVPLLFAAGLAALNWFVALARLREPVRHAATVAEAPGATGGRLGVLRDPVVLRLCLLNFVFSVAVTQLETVFAFFMLDRFGYDAQHVAVVLVGMAIVMGGVQGGGMKALSRRFEERALVAGGAIALGAAFLAMPAMPSVALLVLPLVVSAVGRGVSQPALMSLVSFAATPATRGTVMGSFQASASLARVVGPALAGLLYDAKLALPFWLAGALALLVAAGRGWLPRRVASTD
jgi:MFS family permease